MNNEAEIANAIFWCIAFLAAPFYHWMWMGDANAFAARKGYAHWALTGFLAPLAVWLVFNAGVSRHLPALMLMPDSISEPGFGNAIRRMLFALPAGLLVISSYWSAATFIWIAELAWPNEKDRQDFIRTIIFWCLFLSPIVWLIFYFGGWSWAGVAAPFWAAPIAHFALSTRPLITRVAPSYSRAIGQIKTGKYGAAESEIIRELETFENDFEGWMMLAELYANHFNDFEEAERTIYELGGQPGTNATQFAVAFHRLADWHLKLRKDPAGARRALEEICKKLPGTHLNKMARLRINQLPKDAKELDRHEPIHLPGNAPAGPKYVIKPAITLEGSPQQRADACVALLKNDPNDADARLQLAGIFAEEMGEVKLGIDQLDLITAMPELPETLAVHCLEKMADWEAHRRGDMETARKHWKRLIQEFPRTKEAFNAQREVHLMDFEARMRKMKTGLVTNR